MEKPRPDKVATVGEIAEKMSAVDVVFVSEYRGLTVGALAELRGALRTSGSEHKVYKNTLARRAAVDTGDVVLASSRLDGRPAAVVVYRHTAPWPWRRLS